jgi:hypothetical protein
VNAAENPLHLNNQYRWTGVYSMTERDARNRGGRELVGALDMRDPLRDELGRHPVVQQEAGHVAEGPEPGYFVSQTGSPADDSKRPWQQKRYWDASGIPYAVYATQQWPDLHVNSRDYGLAIRKSTGIHSGFFFGDTRRYGVGECSYRLVRTLTNGARLGPDAVSFLVFPGSRKIFSEGNPTTQIHATMITQLSRLTQAYNADELVLFLALGASLSRFRPFHEGLKNEKKAEIEASVEYQRIRSALFTDWGFSLPDKGRIGDYPRPSEQVRGLA